MNFIFFNGVLSKKNFFKFILRETAQEGEGQREKEGERIPSRLHAVSAEPDVGLEPMKPQDHDLSRNQESDA